MSNSNATAVTTIIVFGGLLAFILFTSASLGNNWINNTMGNHLGLYRYNLFEKEGRIDEWFSDLPYWIGVVRFLTSLSCFITAFVSFIPVVNHFHPIAMPRYAILGLSCASLFMITSLVIYTMSPRMLQQAKWGWSYITAWFGSIVIPLYAVAIALLPYDQPVD